MIDFAVYKTHRVYKAARFYQSVIRLLIQASSQLWSCVGSLLKGSTLFLILDHEGPEK